MDYFIGYFIGSAFSLLIFLPGRTLDSKITNSKPIEISGSVYVCQKAEVKVGK